MHKPVLTVVVSQGQSRSPDKRQLETDIAERSAEIPGVHVMVVPHLYDLARDGETYQKLRGIEGDLLVCAWLFDRATHWVLDRHGVRGQVGEIQLVELSDADEEAEAAAETAVDAPERVVDSQPRPQRHIYCLDLRVRPQADEFIREIARIAELSSARGWLAGDSNLAEAAAFSTPTNTTYVGRVSADSSSPVSDQPTLLGTRGVTTIDEHPTRRWYPVIDFSRCTNCMECIDFCLFGVYGIDSVETILVEQPDNCRKGCPACSRVCPQNAIIFPQHKTPAIAGAPMDTGGFKIDLSKLFGAPDEGADAIEVAARERDEQLLLAGRQAVGMPSELAARLAKPQDQPRDDLDKLIDQLDSLEL